MANVGVHIPAPWFAYGEDIIGQSLHLVSAIDVRKGSQQPCHQCLCLRRLLAKPFDQAHDGQWWNQNSMIWVQILVYHWFWYRICWPEYIYIYMYIYIYTYGGMRTWFLLWTEYTVVCTDWGFVGHPISCHVAGRKSRNYSNHKLQWCGLNKHPTN